MNNIREVRSQKYVRNIISGHEWLEYGDITHYEVYSAYHRTKRCKTLKSAEREKALRDNFDLKFPVG